MNRCQRTVTLLTAVLSFSNALFAHPDDPKVLDWIPPYPGAGWRADVDGVADPHGGGPSFPSSGVTLRSWISIPEFAAAGATGATRSDSCWGYVSPSGREYAIIGLETGIGFVEITNPGNAQIVRVISAPSSIWHDVKVYQNYAYSVSEGGQGIKVFNLTNIDGTGSNRVTHVGNITSGGTSATHTLALNTDSGFLYRAGGGENGLRIYSLANPASPVLAGTWPDRYVHEAQIVSYTEGPYAGREIAFCYGGYNGGNTDTGLDILDVTNKSNIINLGRIVYPGGSFSHQGWLSADKRLVYQNDELDRPTKTRIFDVSDLTNPKYVRSFTNGSEAIGHNLYLRGCLLFESNYTDGLRVFSLANPYHPVEVGHFDSSPDLATVTFNGDWNNYPYFPSGTVILSDIERGLFVLDVSAITSTLTCELGITDVPFLDNFPNSSISSALWTGVSGATISTTALNPPSGPNCIKLGGSATGGNAIRSAFMDLNSLVNPILLFHYQRGGNGDAPEAGDDLIVDYFNSSLQWAELTRIPGSGPVNSSFQSATVPLPANAKHWEFRVRFRVSSNQTNADNWFIDNVAVGAGDSTPPSPTPVFAVSPAGMSATEVTMSASPTSDASGIVQYYFNFTSGGSGGNDSGWISSPTYTDTGLGPNSAFTYRVRARDGAVPVPNTTAYFPDAPSLGLTAYTHIQTPTTMSFSEITETSVRVTADGTFSWLTALSSGLYFEISPAVGVGANVWVQHTSVVVTGLQPGTEYTFRIKGRNRVGVETDFSPPDSVSTVAIPVPCSLLGDMNSDTLIDGDDVNGYIRVKMGTPDQADHVECADFGNSGNVDLDTADFVEALLTE